MPLRLSCSNSCSPAGGAVSEVVEPFRRWGLVDVDDTGREALKVA